MTCHDGNKLARLLTLTYNPLNQYPCIMSECAVGAKSAVSIAITETIKYQTMPLTVGSSFFVVGETILVAVVIFVVFAVVLNLDSTLAGPNVFSKLNCMISSLIVF